VFPMLYSLQLMPRMLEVALGVRLEKCKQGLDLLNELQRL